MKSLDAINGEIKINYNGYNNHPSIFGGVLSLAVAILSLAFGVYAFREIWEKNKPMSNIINKYTPDSGIYHLGIGGLNHFFNIMNNLGEIIEFDNRAITIEAVMKNREGVVNGIYTYGKCSWELDGIDFHEMTANVKKENYEKAACIRSFRNDTNGETILLNEQTLSSFPFGNITHGMESTVPIGQKNVYYITLKECTNSSSNTGTDFENICYSQEKITEYYLGSFYVFGFIDKRFDITNHNQPISNQYNQVEGLMSDKSFTANHLNLNPSTVESNDGLIMDEMKRYRSIYLFQNEKISESKLNNPTLTQVNFWLKNQETIYSRNYSKVQDILASIGGFFNFIYYAAIMINYFPGQYNILIDTVFSLTFNNYVLGQRQSYNNLSDNFACSGNHIKNDYKLSSKKILTNINSFKQNENSSNKNLVCSTFKAKVDNNGDNNNNNRNNNINNENDVIYSNPNFIANDNQYFNSHSNDNKNLNILKIDKIDDPNLAKINKHVDTEYQRLDNLIKYSFWDMICFAFVKSKSPIFKKVEHMRQLIMSENNLFRIFFNEKKKKKMLLDTLELKQMNQIQIFDSELEDLI